MLRKKFTMVIKRENPLVPKVDYVSKPKVDYVSKPKVVTDKMEVVTDKDDVITDNSRKFTDNSRNLTNEVLKQHSLDEINMKEKFQENISLQNNFEKKKFTFATHGHNCIYDSLINEKICSFCNKEFINGIPVVPMEHIMEQDH